MGEVRVTKKSIKFMAADLPLIMAELACQGINGKVQDRRGRSGRIWAVKIGSTWHVHVLSVIKKSVLPGIPQKNPRRDDNALVAFAKAPGGW